MDSQILAARGVRQLTSAERDYYQKLSEAMRSKDPQQAVNNLDIVMPETIVDAVFDELQTSHPLLSRIQFVNTKGAIRMMMNTNGYQRAAWGQLCAEIVQELTSGFKEVDTSLLKLSAFIPVCKAMLELGPEWLDDFVRQVLYEAFANGLEYGIVAGSGNNEPIGMNRQVGDNVTVTGGVYPKKSPITVNDLSPTTVGNLLALLAVDPNGKARTLRDIILIVNPVDYYQRIMPATTVMSPNGTYVNDVLPYPMSIIQSPAVDQGEAIIGIGYKYFAALGTAREGLRPLPLPGGRAGVPDQGVRQRLPHGQQRLLRAGRLRYPARGVEGGAGDRPGGQRQRRPGRSAHRRAGSEPRL